MPGFSGGIMAVSFNVYDRIISASAIFFSKPLKIIKDVWALALGGALGIVLAILGISFFLDKFPIPTVMLFIGLIVGSIPTIFEKVKAKIQRQPNHCLFRGDCFHCQRAAFAKERVLLVQEIDLGLVITLFFLGDSRRRTMVIPGVSGS